MKPISKARVILIVAVAVICLWTTFPTFRYYTALRHKPQLEEPRPAGAARPPAAEVEARAEWEQDNPELAAWYQEHPDYSEWEDKTERLRERAIPLGLDLIGGVDVSLVIDRQKTISTQLAGFIGRLENQFEDQQIAAAIDLGPEGQTAVVNLVDPADARQAANLLSEYEEVITGQMSENALAAGPVTLRYREGYLDRVLNESVEGARKSVEERVNALGVTQPRISVETGQPRRIRLQVPGVSDPDRLIRNVIQPADLEFRLVDRRNDELIDPETGRLRADATLPVGTEVVDGTLAHFDRDKQQLIETDTQFVVRRRADLTGKDLRSASVQFNPAAIGDQITVSLEFKDEGADRFAELTTEYAKDERRLAILLNGKVRSAPVIREPIVNGRAQISGGFTQQEASELSNILKAGSLPAPLKIESKRTVGASLGADSVQSGVQALLIGGVLVAVIMIGYYGMAGTLSVVALLLNVFIILMVMALSRATLTLSGIGGILLTIGMAVDANVLIYERIREELDGGRPLRQAIAHGFGRAFSVIFDANLTTLLTALVLLQFTEGSVFGFALAMTFGLLANLFTGLTVTYTLCALWFQWKGKLSLGKLSILRNTNFNFLGLRYYSFATSGTLILIALALVFMRGGLEMGVDFAGGFHSEVRFSEQVNDADIRQALLGAGLKDPNVQPVLNQPNYYNIDVKLVDAAGQDAEGNTLSPLQSTEQQLRDALAGAFPGGFEVETTAGFGSQTGQEFSELAIVVVLLASIAILCYLWFRFELVFGIAAVIAMLHDLVLVLLLATLWNVQVTLDVVAALMVLLGLSVNDTIVIFDRIRENTRQLGSRTFGEICNLSMNQSLSRTVMTSGTLFVAVLALFIVGGEGLHSFSKVYLLGTLFGTLSSDFIATPIVYMINNWQNNRLQQALARKKKAEGAKKPVRSAGAATRPKPAGS